MGYDPHEQLKSSLGKNLILYLLIGAWLVIALDALVHRELEWPKNLSHELPLEYNSSMGLSSTSTRSRKSFPLVSKAWKVIFQILIKLLHSDFLLKSYDHLQERSRMELNDLISLSMMLWRCHLLWLGHSQNLIVFSWLFEKKSWSFLRTKLEWDWKGCNEGSKIFFAAWRESIITIILDILLVFVAWLILHLITKSSASILITFVAWCSILIIGLSWIWMWEMNIAILFLTLVSVIMRAWVETPDNLIANLSSFWIQSFRLFLHLLTGWKEK